MGLTDKKANSSKFSLREIFHTNSHSQTPSPESHPSTPQEVPVQSHRFLLKKKDSKGSVISPQSSSSSLSSILKRNRNNGHDDGLHPESSAADGASSKISAPNSLNVTPYTSNENTKEKDDSSSQHTLSSSHQTTPQHHHQKPVASSGGHKDHHHKDHHKDHHHHSHSHLSLKRFLKKLKHSPSREAGAGGNTSSAASIASSHLHLTHSNNSEIFKKYGSVGRLLGAGASGSVSLITSETDPSKIFAVKKFRSKLPNENDSDYKTKVKNEFKIGEVLVHQNVIHTVELIKESSSKFLSEPEYFIIMEYCPFDFFNLVMSGLMDRNEIACYFKQIINGVGYLHSMGLAHRDLKLDNCVVNEYGILKLIDFGSAVQFRKEKSSKDVTAPDANLADNHKLIRARGIVGSDPYLAPEVFEPSNFGYDPRLVDVWSIAIIYCCMILKRFPWKLPKDSDPSYKSFAGIEDKSGKAPVQKSAKGGDASAVNKVVKDLKDLNVSEASSRTPTEQQSQATEVSTILTTNSSTPASSEYPTHTSTAADVPSITTTPAASSEVPTDRPGTPDVPSISTTPPSPTPASAAAQQPAAAPASAPASASSSKKLPPRGADRLLRILPTACRPLIKGMLTIDTTKRFFIEDIVKDPFYLSIELCTQDRDSEFVAAENHSHHLVTEEELQKLNEEKEKLKNLKDAGVA